jgi:hypothetical protein
VTSDSRDHWLVRFTPISRVSRWVKLENPVIKLLYWNKAKGSSLARVCSLAAANAGYPPASSGLQSLHLVQRCIPVLNSFRNSWHFSKMSFRSAPKTSEELLADDDYQTALVSLAPQGKLLQSFKYCQSVAEAKCVMPDFHSPLLVENTVFSLQSECRATCQQSLSDMSECSLLSPNTPECSRTTLPPPPNSYVLGTQM